MILREIWISFPQSGDDVLGNQAVTKKMGQLQEMRAKQQATRVTIERQFVVKAGAWET